MFQSPTGGEGVAVGRKSGFYDLVLSPAAHFHFKLLQVVWQSSLSLSPSLRLEGALACQVLGPLNDASKSAIRKRFAG